MLRTLRRWLAWLAPLLALFGIDARADAACPPPVPQPSAAALQAAQRHDRGLLWRLQRDGRTSYLYGTLHVGRPEWTTPGPQVSAAFAATDVLALEVDPADPGVQRELAATEPAPPLPQSLERRLAQAVAAACVPAGALASMHPALQAVLLGVLEARWAGLDPAYAQEAALARLARDRGRPVVALETVELQRKVLVPDDDAAALAELEQMLDQLESGSGRRAIGKLAQAWEHGDLATLEAHDRWCDCMRTADERAAMRALNDDRNPALADGIAALHASGRRVFAAVGALHMTGPQALPRLLAAHGFSVERIAFAR